MNQIQNEDAKIKIQPLPTGEHPWAKRLRKNRKYVSRASLILSVLLTLVLWSSGYTEQWSEMLSARFKPPFISGLLYAGLLAVLFGIFSFPASLLSYVIEKRFGLSIQTLKDWMADQLKGLTLGVVLGTIIVLSVIAALVFGGSNWWWICALGSLVFGVLLTRLAPQLILPLFFKLKPVDSPELQKRFSELAARTNTPVLGIFEIDLSRRTRAANAAVIGFGASRKAVVGDTLLAEFSIDETEFVLAHELAHHRYHDLWLGIAISAVLVFIGLALTNTVVSEIASAHGITFPPTRDQFSPVILFWIAVSMSVLQTVFSPISKYFSRFAETRADRFAADQTRHSMAGASAFRKLGFQNIVVFRPPLVEELLFHTHPAIARRIERLERLTTT